MDCCLICLEFSSDSFSRIKGNSEEWETYSIERIIEKHLWWWHSKANHTSYDTADQKWICQVCWQQLWTFHTFYMRVEEIHNNFYIKLNQTKTIPEENCLADEIPYNEKNHKDDKTSERTLLEDLIPITKRRRGRPRLQDDNLKDIKIEELSVLEVNNEKLAISLEAPQDHCETNTEQQQINEFGDDDCKSTESSDSRESLFEDMVANNSVKKRYKTSKKAGRELKERTVKSKSTVILTKRYDDFIASHHELFCSLCHVPLIDFQNLITHFREKHKIKAFAMCCGKKFFKRAVFVDHLHTHTNPDYFKCQECGKVLLNRRCLKNHLEGHDNTRKPNFNCKDCGKDFFKRGSYEKHKLLHVPEEDRRFQCSECDKKFASESLRTQHMKVTHLNKYAKICDICGKPFRERHSFQRHLAEHTGVPTDPIQCDICGMKLTSTYGLNRHKRLRHIEENMQEQICPYCSKVSPNIAAHRSHIQYSHTMQRKHACHLCEKAFRRPKELKEHLSTHTGEALYTCPYCPRTFISNANMHKHRKNEHPKEWEEDRLKRLAACHAAVSEKCINA